MYYLSEVIYNVMIPNFIKSSNKILGSSFSLPAHGRVGARATPFITTLFAKQKTKFGGGGTPVVERFAFTTGQEARAGKNSSPPQPLSFLPARAKIIKSQRRDFREKKFGFCSGQTASL